MNYNSDRTRARILDTALAEFRCYFLRYNHIHR